MQERLAGAAREKAFREKGGGSRATYHRHKKELLRCRNQSECASAAAIKLKPPRPDAYTLAMADRRKQLEAMRDEDDQPDGAVKSTEDTDNNSDKGDIDQETAVVDRVSRLRREMEKAVNAENYELAAKLRDEIRKFQIE